MIMRPLVLLREGITDVALITRVACFCHFYIVNYLHRSGTIENNLFIFDLENVSPFGLPFKMMAAVEDTMKAQFKCVTCKVFVLNCSKAFVFGWAAVKGLLDPLVAQKVSLIGSNTCDEIKDLVPQDQLLEEFGGSAKRPERNWPPTIPLKHAPKQKKQETDKAASGHSRVSSHNEEDLDLSDEEQPVYLPKNMNCRSNTLN